MPNKDLQAPSDMQTWVDEMSDKVEAKVAEKNQQQFDQMSRKQDEFQTDMKTEIEKMHTTMNNIQDAWNRLSGWARPAAAAMSTSASNNDAPQPIGVPFAGSHSQMVPQPIGVPTAGSHSLMVPQPIGNPSTGSHSHSLATNHPQIAQPGTTGIDALLEGIGSRAGDQSVGHEQAVQLEKLGLTAVQAQAQVEVEAHRTEQAEAFAKLNDNQAAAMMSSNAANLNDNQAAALKAEAGAMMASNAANLNDNKLQL
mmetsp:Transcript_21035/g.49993  ORF Transcript_21035/g.49993 Transcript_21035/m.49993 type:complete len:254 (-) Transcript_21035:10-771(-)